MARVSKLKLQNEINCREIVSLKQREAEIKLREEASRKQDEQTLNEARKEAESRCKQLSADLHKQIGSNKTLRSEVESLNSKLKLNEEKLAHVERDLTQKKQLIEFYKKKAG